MQQFFSNITAFATDHRTTIIGVLVIAVLGALLYGAARRYLRNALRKLDLAPPVQALLLRFVGWTIALLVALLILHQVGVLPNVWAGILAVLATVAIGFVAGWSLLSNVFCTLLILIYRPFRIGDTVELPPDPVKGEAVDLNVMYTTLKTPNGSYAQVPNSMFFTRPIIRTPGHRQVGLYDQLSADKPVED